MHFSMTRDVTSDLQSQTNPIETREMRSLIVFSRAILGPPMLVIKLLLDVCVKFFSSWTAIDFKCN